jgi:hypothetical protein
MNQHAPDDTHVLQNLAQRRDVLDRDDPQVANHADTVLAVFDPPVTVHKAAGRQVEGHQAGRDMGYCHLSAPAAAGFRAK